MQNLQTVTGETPNNAPIEMQIASVQYANVERGKSPVSWSTTPENRAMLYSVAVQSIISTYKNVNNAMANCPRSLPIFQSRTFRVWSMGWKSTTFLKKAKRLSPIAVSGKYVKEVSRLSVSGQPLESFVVC